MLGTLGQKQAGNALSDQLFGFCRELLGARIHWEVGPWRGRCPSWEERLSPSRTQRFMAGSGGNPAPMPLLINWHMYLWKKAPLIKAVTLGLYVSHPG